MEGVESLYKLEKALKRNGEPGPYSAPTLAAGNGPVRSLLWRPKRRLSEQRLSEPCSLSTP